MTPRRYHTTLVVLHWLLVPLMLVELGLSTYLLSFPNNMPEKIMALRNHMVAGNLILILSIVRFLVRMKTDRPGSASGGNPAMDQLATMGHYGLYALTVLMAVSGLVLAAQANLPSVVFNGIGSLPANFSGFGARAVHGWIAKVLIALIAGHVLAALYHQFIRKDGLLGRMGFGKRY